jgi:hypothetical protein
MKDSERLLTLTRIIQKGKTQKGFWPQPESLRKERPTKERLKKTFKTNWNHSERNHSEGNHSERKDSERKDSERKHSEKNDIYTSRRQYFKCFGIQSFRGRALTDLTVLKKLPPSQPSWPRAAGNKHIFISLGACTDEIFLTRYSYFSDQI